MAEVLIGVAGHMRVAMISGKAGWGGRTASLFRPDQGLISWDPVRRTAIKTSVKEIVTGTAKNLLVVHCNFATPLYVAPETEFYIPATDTWAPASLLQPQMRLQALTVVHAKALGLAKFWQGQRRSDDVVQVLGVEKAWSRKKDDTQLRSNIRREFRVYGFTPEMGTGFFINSILVRTHR